MEQNIPKRKNYKFAFVLLKLLQPFFGILFYVSIFFIALCLILSVILLFVKVDVDQLLLFPFMHKIAGEAGKITAYDISFGNGIKIITDVKNVVLDDIKAVLFAGLFVLICTLATIAPVFKFLAMLLKNINSGEYEKIIDEKNPRYVMFTGLCIFIGAILIRFVMRFYNYYLAARFIDAVQTIKLSLGVDALSGITGLTIVFIGFVFAYALKYIRNKE